MGKSFAQVGTSKVPILLMEDHRDAYFFWKELKIEGATCLHVDAHLDVCDRRVPGYSGVRPEINCGNYLLPALRENVVARLIWVVPPYLKGSQTLLEWVREELQNWVHPTVTEYNSWSQTGTWVEGELLGKPFFVCESHALCPIGSPLLLDIDADYYLDSQDGVWQSPVKLLSQLEIPKPAALTVAYSVQGGFTPVHRRYLGDLTVAAFLDSDRARSLLALLESEEEPSDEEPAWLRAAWWLGEELDIHSRQYERAVDIDPKVRAEALDLAWWRLSRRDFEGAERWIEQLHPGLERSYLSGLSDFYQKNYRRANQHFQPLLEIPDLEPTTRRHLLELQARGYLAAGASKQSESASREALELDRRDPDLWRLLGSALHKQGGLEQAARCYRKAISCYRDKLDGLSTLLDLAQTYLDLGQPEPALTQCRRVTKGDAPSLLKIQAEAIALKARLKRGRN